MITKIVDKIITNFFDFFFILLVSFIVEIIAFSLASSLLSFSPLINSSILISNSLHSFLYSDTSGKLKPLSYLLTAFMLTPIFSASCS